MKIQFIIVLFIFFSIFVYLFVKMMVRLRVKHINVNSEANKQENTKPTYIIKRKGIN